MCTLYQLNKCAYWHYSTINCVKLQDYGRLKHAPHQTTLVPPLRYGNLLAENCEFFLTHSHLTPLLRVKPFVYWMSFLSPKVVLWTVRRRRFCNPSLYCFDTVRACDRQTDNSTISNCNEISCNVKWNVYLAMEIPDRVSFVSGQIVTK